MDHDALRCIWHMTQATITLQQWRLPQSWFDLDGVLQTGVKHQAAGGVYRLPAIIMNASPLQDDLAVLAIAEVQPE